MNARQRRVIKRDPSYTGYYSVSMPELVILGFVAGFILFTLLGFLLIGTR